MADFSVLGCGVYTPHTPTLASWAQQTPTSEPTSPQGRALDRRSRRISGTLMRALTDVAYDAIEAAQVDPQSIASVYGSALGEVQTMMKLLEQIWVKKDPPSPMAFAASVHNAASGVASISFKNQQFTTSVAANFDTPAMSLWEAAGLLRTGHKEVLVVCGDEPPPHALMGPHPTWDTLCAALVLSADPAHPRRIASLQLPTRSVPDASAVLPAATLQPSLQNNPSVGMLRVVDAIVQGNNGMVALDHGNGQGWYVRVTPP